MSKKIVVALVALFLMGTCAISAMAKDQLVISQNTAATTMHPLALTMTPEQSIACNMYEGLVDRDPTGKLTPSLATSWQQDGTVWRFNLRKGVKWHSGAAFSADDVMFTFKMAELPINRYKFVTEKIKEVRKIDEYTVEIVTKHPWSMLADSLYQTIVIMSKKDFEGKDDAYIAEHPVGTGPYKFVDWVRGSHMNLVAFDEHWAGAPKIKKVVFRPINNDATRLAGLMSGSIDLTSEVPIQNINMVKNNAKLNVVTQNSALSIFLMIRSSNPELPTAKLKVRQAMMHAINMDEIVQTILYGQSAVASQLPAKFFKGYNTEIKRPEFNLEKARQLLAEAGYPNGFEITLNTTQDRYIMDKEMCLAVAQQLSKVGIKVKLVAQPHAVHLKAVRAKQYDFYLMGWNETTFDSARFLGEFVKTGAVWNGSEISDPKLDALLDKADKANDPAEGAAILREANAYVAEQVLVIPMHHPLDIYGVSKAVKNFKPNVKKVLTLRDLSF